MRPFLYRKSHHWPENEEGVLDVHGYQLSWLLDGLVLNQSEAHQHLSYETMI